MDVMKLATANTEFGLNLFRLQVGQQQAKNTVLSPFSLSSALGMTLLGAKGDTAQGIVHTLCWTSDDTMKMHKEFQAYISLVKQPCDKFELSLANRIYIENKYTPMEQFVSDAKEHYLATPASANFIEGAEDERLKINHWVAEQTNGKIKGLIAPNGLNCNTRLVLVNALYFKGLWKHRFMSFNTHKRHFKISPGNTKRVEMMSASENYHIAESRHLKCSALEIPYRGGDMSMVIILPDEDFGLRELETKLTSAEVTGLVKKLKRVGKVALSFPKFQVTSNFQLKAPLSTLGMSQAFDSLHADFTGIKADAELYISQVFHQVFVKVHERGTEAAAATAVDERDRCRETPPRNTFHVDHPFLILIIDKRAANTVLFLGRVEDPSSE